MGDAGGEVVVVVHGREVAGGGVGVVGGEAARPGAGGEASGSGVGVGRSLAVGVLFGEEKAALGGVVPGGEGGPGVAGEIAPGFQGFHAAGVVVGVFHGVGAGAGGALALARGVVGVGDGGAVGPTGKSTQPNNPTLSQNMTNSRTDPFTTIQLRHISFKEVPQKNKRVPREVHCR